MIQCARPAQRLPAVRTFVTPKSKNVLPESCLSLPFTEKLRAVNMVFHADTALPQI